MFRLIANAIHLSLAEVNVSVNSVYLLFRFFNGPEKIDVDRAILKLYCRFIAWLLLITNLILLYAAANSKIDLPSNPKRLTCNPFCRVVGSDVSLIVDEDYVWLR